MGKKILEWLENHGRKRIIYERGGDKPYIERYYLLFPPRDNSEERPVPFNIFLHHILESDEPTLHDHPWWFLSVILKGGYLEHLKDGSMKWKLPGSVIFHKAIDYHWLELPTDWSALINDKGYWAHTHLTVPKTVTAWTLFIHGPRVRVWGFLKEGLWVDWKTYIARKRDAAVSQG